MFEYVRITLLTSRPALWWIHVLFFAAGYLVSGAAITSQFWVFAVLLAFPGSLIVYGINDVFDYASDVINPRKNSASGFVLKPQYHSSVLIAAAVGACLLGIAVLLTKDWFTILSGTALLFLVVAYSAPPLRLKERPVLDSLSNGLMVLGIGLFGFSFHASFSQVPLAAYVLALLAACIHAYCAFMDCSVDLQAKQRTIATVFGKQVTMVFCLLCTLSALLFFWLGKYQTPFIFISALGVLVFMALSIHPSEKLARTLQWPLLAIGAVCVILVLKTYL